MDYIKSLNEKLKDLPANKKIAECTNGLTGIRNTLERWLRESKKLLEKDPDNLLLRNQYEDSERNLETYNALIDSYVLQGYSLQLMLELNKQITGVLNDNDDFSKQEVSSTNEKPASIKKTTNLN